MRLTRHQLSQFFTPTHYCSAESPARPLPVSYFPLITRFPWSGQDPTAETVQEVWWRMRGGRTGAAQHRRRRHADRNKRKSEQGQRERCQGKSFSEWCRETQNRGFSEFSLAHGFSGVFECEGYLAQNLHPETQCIHSFSEPTRLAKYSDARKLRGRHAK